MFTNTTTVTTSTWSAFVVPSLGCAYGPSAQGTGVGFSAAMRARNVDAVPAIVPSAQGLRAWRPPIT